MSESVLTFLVEVLDLAFEVTAFVAVIGTASAAAVLAVLVDRILSVAGSLECLVR